MCPQCEITSNTPALPHNPPHTHPPRARARMHTHTHSQDYFLTLYIIIIQQYNVNEYVLGAYT